MKRADLANNPEKPSEVPVGLKCLGLLLLIFFGAVLLVMQPAVFGIIIFTIICVSLDIDEEKIMMGFFGLIMIAFFLFIPIFVIIGLYNTTLDFFNYVSQYL